MKWSQVEYARAADAHIAYRTVVGDPGSGLTIVMVNGFFYPLEVLRDDPLANRLIEGLARLGTLVLFDRRGIGLSDQIVDWETHVLDHWVEDLGAVVDAVGCEAVTVFSWHGFGTGRRFAARHPERVDRLVLFNAFPRPDRADLHWIVDVRQRIDGILVGTTDGSAALPNRRNDPVFREWLDRAGRLGASPSQAARLNAAEATAPPPLDPAAAVIAPTLVIVRATPEFGVPGEFLERAARELPNASCVTLPDGDAFPIGADVDAVLAEISRFLTGTVQLPHPEREVKVIMFTDLVESTRRAAAEGDARWRALLDRHDFVCEVAAARVNGTVVKSTGDGIFALFPSVPAAVAAARDMQRQLSDDGLSIRTGIHVGEIDHRGDDASGMAINMTARVMAEAAPGELLLTEIAVSIGDMTDATPAGDRSLKGSDRSWTLFRL
ncbi:MAG TPA: adenylate/guanylate cyclase domain-containing protein [Acidimicrobiales bacterium]|nr:adenylate/guanylate cyclase domain-containing protein [Acidimicrobiales bacterium]